MHWLLRLGPFRSRPGGVLASCTRTCRSPRDRREGRTFVFAWRHCRGRLGGSRCATCSSLGAHISSCQCQECSTRRRWQASFSTRRWQGGGPRRRPRRQEGSIVPQDSRTSPHFGKKDHETSSSTDSNSVTGAMAAGELSRVCASNPREGRQAERGALRFGLTLLLVAAVAAVVLVRPQSLRTEGRGASSAVAESNTPGL